MELVGHQKNTRTGEKSPVYKVYQSEWDNENEPEEIENFFAYQVPGIKDTENGDIIIEITEEEYLTPK